MEHPFQGVNPPHLPSLLAKLRDDLLYHPCQVQCVSQVTVLYYGEYPTVIIGLVGAYTQLQ